MLRRLGLIITGMLIASSQALMAYEEESSFGTINPDEAARPAAGYPEVKQAEPVEEPAASEPPAPAPQKELPKGQQGTSQQRPKYRDYYEQASRRQRGGYNDEESVAVSLGIGFGFRYFQGSLGVGIPINRYMAWGLGGQYFTREDDKEAEVRTGGDLSLILRLPNPTPIAPFLTAGPGFESWKRSKDEADGKGKVVFHEDDSPTVNWSVGASLRLARYVALVGALKSTTYTDRPPRLFSGDHSKRELRTNERFELGFAFIF
jgi:hypothetical protein